MENSSPFTCIWIHTYRYGKGYGVQLCFAQMATENRAHHTNEEDQELCHELEEKKGEGEGGLILWP